MSYVLTGSVSLCKTILTRMPQAKKHLSLTLCLGHFNSLCSTACSASLHALWVPLCLLHVYVRLSVCLFIHFTSCLSACHPLASLPAPRHSVCLSACLCLPYYLLLCLPLCLVQYFMPSLPFSLPLCLLLCSLFCLPLCTPILMPFYILLALPFCLPHCLHYCLPF